jgi:uracil-DNA glycosylase
MRHAKKTNRLPNNTVMNEISKELISDIQKCSLCKTIIGHKKFPTVSHGQLKGKYLLVSEAPGRESLFKQQYWTGVGGQILRSCTTAANTTLESIFYLTDIVKCWPNENGNNRTPFDREIQNCSHFLTKEIEELKPPFIISFGKPASTFLLKREVRVKMEHGSIFNYNKDTKIIVLLHPTGIDRQMDRNIYKKQLTALFLKLKEGKHNEIAEIFKT